MPQRSRRCSASAGVTLAIGFSVGKDLAAGRLIHIKGPGLQAPGEWCALTLTPAARQPAVSELVRFITTPAMHPGHAPRRRRRRHPIPAEDPRDAVELDSGAASSARIRLAESHGPLCRLPLTKNVGVELRSITSASCGVVLHPMQHLRRMHTHVFVELLEIEPDRVGVAIDVRPLQVVLVIEQLHPHLEVLALQPGRLCGPRGIEGAGVHPLQG